jgi:hypothetical protein
MTDWNMSDDDGDLTDRLDAARAAGGGAVRIRGPVRNTRSGSMVMPPNVTLNGRDDAIVPLRDADRHPTFYRADEVTHAAMERAVPAIRPGSFGIAAPPVEPRWTVLGSEPRRSRPPYVWARYISWHIRKAARTLRDANRAVYPRQ